MDIRSQMIVEARPQPTKVEGEAARVCLEYRELLISEKEEEREK